MHETPHVRRAEWFEGQLRVLLGETEDGIDSQVLALSNFAPEDFDTLWRFFEQCCGVYVKRHHAVAAVSESDFDGAMRGIEDAAVISIRGVMHYANGEIGYWDISEWQRSQEMGMKLVQTPFLRRAPAVVRRDPDEDWRKNKVGRPQV